MGFGGFGDSGLFLFSLSCEFLLGLGTMKSTGSALRSAGRLVGLHRKSCAAVAQPAPVVGIAGFSSGVREDSGTFVPVLDSKLVRGGGLREEADPKFAFPSLPSVHLQRRGFLSCGDGDEDSGLSKHFEEDRVLGYVSD